MSERALMRKAIRVDDGSIRVPRDMTDEEFDYAWGLHTPRERERLAKQTNRMLRWTVWRMKHPRLAAFLDGAAYVGSTVMR